MKYYAKLPLLLLSLALFLGQANVRKYTNKSLNLSQHLMSIKVYFGWKILNLLFGIAILGKLIAIDMF